MPLNSVRKTQGQNGRGRVLVVDDDPIVLEVVRERLAGAGFEVHVREDALGTTHWVSTNKPDVVLLDVNMPALSGVELAQLLRKRAGTQQTSIILHSGMSGPELEPLVAATQALGVIEKTSNEQQFLAQFERLLATRRISAEPRE